MQSFISVKKREIAELSCVCQCEICTYIHTNLTTKLCMVAIFRHHHVEIYQMNVISIADNLEFKSPRFSPPHLHNIVTNPPTAHLVARGIPRNLSIISERSSSSLSGEAGSDETPLVTPRESTVYIDMDGRKAEGQQEEKPQDEDASPPPESLRNRRKLSISLPDIASLAETAGLLFASGTVADKDGTGPDCSFDSESDEHDSGDSETSSALLTAPSETNTPSTSPTPLQPAIVQTMPSPQAATPPKLATSRVGLSASFSSAMRPHGFGAKGGTTSLPSSPQHMQTHDFQSESKPHPNLSHSWHLSMHPPPSPNGLDAKTDKRHSLGREGEGKKEVDGSVTKRPSFKHQTSQEAPNALKKHKKHSTFNIKG